MAILSKFRIRVTTKWTIPQMTKRWQRLLCFYVEKEEKSNNMGVILRR